MDIESVVQRKLLPAWKAKQRKMYVMTSMSTWWDSVRILVRIIVYNSADLNVTSGIISVLDACAFG